MDYRGDRAWAPTWERTTEGHRSSSYLKYQEAMRGTTRIANPLNQTGFSSAPKLKPRDRIGREPDNQHWLRLAQPERVTETPRDVQSIGYRTQGWVRQRPLNHHLTSTGTAFRPLESPIHPDQRQIMDLNKKVDGLATQMQTVTAMLLDYNRLGPVELTPSNHHHVMARTSTSSASRKFRPELPENSAHYSVQPEQVHGKFTASKATSDTGKFLKAPVPLVHESHTRTNPRPPSRGGVSSLSTPNSINGKKPHSHGPGTAVGDKSTSNNFFKPPQFAEDRIKHGIVHLDSSPPSKSGSGPNLDAMGEEELRELRDKIDMKLRIASER